MGLSSGSVPAWDWAKWEDTGGPKSNGWLSCVPSLCSLTEMFGTYGSNILGIVGNIFVLDCSSLLSCVLIWWVCSLATRPDATYSGKEKEKKQKKEKETLICMGDFCKERGIFSHWQILSSCVSNETEASESLVYVFVPALTLLMSAKKMQFVFWRGPCFPFPLSTGMVASICHTL